MPCKIGEIGVTQTVEKCIMVKRMQALKWLCYGLFISKKHSTQLRDIASLRCFNEYFFPRVEVQNQ